jgi:hypothetical protein
MGSRPSSKQKLILADRPIHAIVLLFFATGTTLIGIRRSSSSLFRSKQESPQDNSLQLDDLAAPDLVEDIPKTVQENDVLAQSQRARLRVLLGAAVVALVARIELFRRILKATECTTSSIEV